MACLTASGSRVLCLLHETEERSRRRFRRISIQRNALYSSKFETTMSLEKLGLMQIGSITAL